VVRAEAVVVLSATNVEKSVILPMEEEAAVVANKLATPVVVMVMVLTPILRVVLLIGFKATCLVIAPKDRNVTIVD
jgi:hypothetical protein